MNYGGAYGYQQPACYGYVQIRVGWSEHVLVVLVKSWAALIDQCAVLCSVKCGDLVMHTVYLVPCASLP